MQLHEEDTYNVYIAQFVQPEVVDGCRGGHEIAFREILVDFLGSNVKLVEDPLLNQSFLASRLNM